MTITAPNPQERTRAIWVHLSAWLNILPLCGVFVAANIYRRSSHHSPWVARHALRSSLFQLMAINLLFILLAIVVPAAAIAWESRYDDGALHQVIFLTVLPFYLSAFLIQATVATVAARAVQRGENFHYPIIDRLIKPHTARATDKQSE